MNKRVFESLVKAGACDSLAARRRASPLDGAARAAVRRRRPRASSTAAARSAIASRARRDLFGGGDGDGGDVARSALPDGAAVDGDRAARLREGGARPLPERPSDRSLRRRPARLRRRRSATCDDRAAAAPTACPGGCVETCTIGGIVSGLPAAQDPEGRPHVRLHARGSRRAASRSWSSPRRSSSAAHLIENGRWCSCAASSSATTSRRGSCAAEIMPLEPVRERLSSAVVRSGVDAAARARDVRARSGTCSAQHHGDRRVAFEIECAPARGGCACASTSSAADPRAAVGAAGARTSSGSAAPARSCARADAATAT